MECKLLSIRNSAASYKKMITCPKKLILSQMKSKKTIQIVSCHAEGEVGNVIIGGVELLLERLFGISLDGFIRINRLDSSF